MPTEIEELERKINRQQTLLNMYEDNLRLEDDPRRILKLQENIEEVKALILGYQTQVARIRQAQAPPLPRSPAPTAFIANAPYGLETALVGREDERLLLDDWFSHDAGHPLLAMIALGGMGKSALTWDWLQDLICQKKAPPLVVWWSFYETDGTMDNLMVEVLQHFGDDPSQFPNLRVAVMRFIEHLRQTPAFCWCWMGPNACCGPTAAWPQPIRATRMIRPSANTPGNAPTRSRANCCCGWPSRT